MERDKNVFCLGEDIGAYGGAFKVTEGLMAKFGEQRVIDTPISETAIIGAAAGAAHMGMRPVCEMQFIDFISTRLRHAHELRRDGALSRDAAVSDGGARAERRVCAWRAVPLAESGSGVSAHPRSEDRLSGDGERRQRIAEISDS